MVEAPIPKVSIAAEISVALQPKTYFNSANQMEISRSPRPTTTKPITEPAEKAILRPLPRLDWAAQAVRLLACVAIFMPKKPESAEKRPPVIKAKGVNQLKFSRNAAIAQRTTNITAKKTPTTVYCRLKYALAPERIEREIFFISSVPSSARKTRLAVTAA